MERFTTAKGGLGTFCYLVKYQEYNEDYNELMPELGCRCPDLIREYTNALLESEPTSTSSSEDSDTECVPSLPRRR